MAAQDVVLLAAGAADRLTYLRVLRALRDLDPSLTSAEAAGVIADAPTRLVEGVSAAAAAQAAAELTAAGARVAIVAAGAGSPRTIGGLSRSDLLRLGDYLEPGSDATHRAQAESLVLAAIASLVDAGDLELRLGERRQLLVLYDTVPVLETRRRDPQPPPIGLERDLFHLVAPGACDVAQLLTLLIDPRHSDPWRYVLSLVDRRLLGVGYLREAEPSSLAEWAAALLRDAFGELPRLRAAPALSALVLEAVEAARRWRPPHGHRDTWWPPHGHRDTWRYVEDAVRRGLASRETLD